MVQRTQQQRRTTEATQFILDSILHHRPISESQFASLGDNVNVKYKNIYGDTLLILAIEARREDIVNFLLNKGADANTPGGTFTPLTYAIRFREKNILKSLLQHGADIFQRDSTNNTPEDWLNLYPRTDSKDLRRIIQEHKTKQSLRRKPVEQLHITGSNKTQVSITPPKFSQQLINVPSISKALDQYNRLNSKKPLFDRIIAITKIVYDVLNSNKSLKEQYKSDFQKAQQFVKRFS